MSLVNIISAIGNNKSIYPLIVRDCGIEVPTKIAMTYNQNKEDKKIAWLGARERFIDEYSVSAVWLGGIPLIDKIANKYITKKMDFKTGDSTVNLELLKEEKFQGLKYNIEKFKDIPEAQKAVSDLRKLSTDAKALDSFKKLSAGKFAASIIVPIAIMGFVIPKLIFASTAKKMKRYQDTKIQEQKNVFFGMRRFNEFAQGKKEVSFTSNWMSAMNNFSTQQKMIVTDGGYAFGRVATARKKNEAIDIAFKMAGMMFLNFVAPHWIEKGFNKLTNVDLDPKILANKRFLAKVKYNELELPVSNSPKDMLAFIDENKNSIFTKLAAKFDKVKLLEGGIRDPRAYVKIEGKGGLVEFKNNIEKFVKKAQASRNIRKVANRAKYVKYFTILSNIGLSSFLLAYCLPKAQFLFREWFTGSKFEPGLVINNSKQN